MALETGADTTHKSQVIDLTGEDDSNSAVVHHHVQKVKPIWILLKQKTVSGSGISWASVHPAPDRQPCQHPTTL